MKTYAIILFVFISAVIWSPGQAQTMQAEAGVQSDDSDWDWADVEVMDDTPVSSKQVIRKDVSSVSANRITLEQSATPDLKRTPRKAYPLFEGMPPFEVIASRRDTEIYPCKSCHEWVKSNLEPRALKQPHDNFELKHGLHGKGQLWCFTCHDKQDKEMLITLQGEYVEFEDAYILCSQCHANEARDWAFGVHGKRLANWKGERQVYNCTACHYQHSPAFKTRQALSGPEIRMGLDRPAHWVPRAERHSVPHESTKPWQKYQEPDKTNTVYE